VGEVGVHLQDEAGAARERLAEAGDVSRAEPFLARAVEDVDVLVPRRQSVGDRAGPVGRAVVDDQHLGVRRQLRAGGLDQRLHVLGLVVGRQHQPGGARGGLGHRAMYSAPVTNAEIAAALEELGILSSSTGQ
jgi:hypothetical protein